MWLLLFLVPAGIVLAVLLLSRGYDGPGAEELSARLDEDLAAWEQDLARQEPYVSELLRPLAGQAGAPLPAERPSPGSVRSAADGEQAPEEILAHLAAEQAKKSAAEGRLIDAVDLLHALILYGEDAHAGRGFDAPFHPAVEAGEKVLRDLTADELLDGAALERAIENERARLKTGADPIDAWRYRLLDAQVLIRSMVRGEPVQAEVDWAGPVERLFGLHTSAPDRSDFLCAWNGIRAEFKPLLAAARAADEPGIDRASRAIRQAGASAGDTVFGRIASAILIYGGLARDSYEDWRRHREARLFGLLMLRHKQQHGAFPDDLESIRVPEIPPSPHGGAWRLGTDLETKKPAIFLDGGRVYTYQVLAPEEGDFHSDRETKPLFSFR